jgi:hypothetical protein
MSVKKQLAEMYGLPYRPSSILLLLKKWQAKRKASLKRRKERKNKEKE